jgi:hypothetical protein
MNLKPLAITPLLVGCVTAVAVVFVPGASAEPNQCQSGGTGSAGPSTCEPVPPAVTATPPVTAPSPDNGPYGPSGDTPPIG